MPTGFDNVPIDHFKNQLDQAIADGSIFQEGWRLEANTYDVMGSDFGHTSIEIHGPDGSKFYASLDTYNFDDDGSATLIPYDPGSEMRMAVDQNREDNVVTKGQPQGSYSLAEGSGVEMILRFGQLVEKGSEFNKSEADFNLASINTDSYLSTFNALVVPRDQSRTALEDDTKQEFANSNSGPIQALEDLGYDVSALRVVNRDGLDVVGADDDVSRLFTEQEKGFFESIDPASGVAAAVADPESEVYKRLVALTSDMHPDRISENMAKRFAREREVGGHKPEGSVYDLDL